MVLPLHIRNIILSYGDVVVTNKYRLVLDQLEYLVTEFNRKPKKIRLSRDGLRVLTTRGIWRSYWQYGMVRYILVQCYEKRKLNHHILDKKKERWLKRFSRNG